MLERDGGESGCWEEGTFSRAGSTTVPLITSRRKEICKEVEGGRQVEGGGNWEISVISPTRLEVVLLFLYFPLAGLRWERRSPLPPD
jgi:hypothetical protein